MTSLGAVDIGSNSVRLFIAGADGAELCREMHITRLAEGVDRTGRLAEAAMLRTLEVLGQYAGLLAQHGTTQLRVTGTSAARDAENRADFFARVQGTLGSAPELLSGQAEAALAFRGATADREPAFGPFVTLDIGGGSTEFAYGTSEPEQSISLDIGCVRITERFFTTDPPSGAELDAAAEYIRGLLQKVEREARCRAAKTWLGLAGTVTSLAARDAGLSVYDPNVTHGYSLRRERIEQMHAELTQLSLEQRARWLIEPKRAGVILGGSVILREVLRFFGLSEITVSERDILDGLVASLRDA
jgi:exopolyphosphatase/guanosine-5'-triphosphate,3'-diphosphate pyrophosphatase